MLPDSNMIKEETTNEIEETSSIKAISTASTYYEFIPSLTIPPPNQYVLSFEENSLNSMTDPIPTKSNLSVKRKLKTKLFNNTIQLKVTKIQTIRYAVV